MARDYSKLDTFIDAYEHGETVANLGRMVAGGPIKEQSAMAKASGLITSLIALGIVKRREKARGMSASEFAAFKAWKAAGCPGLSAAE